MVVKLKIYSISKPMYFPSVNFIRNLIKSDVFVLNDKTMYKNELGIMKIDSKEYKIPVLFKKGDKYKDVKICNIIDWQKKHYDAIVDKYKDTTYYNKYIDIFKTLYCRRRWDKLMDFNISVLSVLSYMLKITTDIYERDINKNKIEIGNIFECNVYLKSYNEKDIDEEKFKNHGIKVKDITIKEQEEESILDFMFYKDCK